MNVSQNTGEKLKYQLFYYKSDLLLITGISERSLDRFISGGEFPKPDLRLNKRPLWRKETVKNWVESLAA